MLNFSERECLVKFIGYHGRGFTMTCNGYSCCSTKIVSKLNKHKTANDNYREAKLTHQEQVVLTGFLRKNITEFRIWCGVYEVGDTSIFNALKRMVQ